MLVSGHEADLAIFIVVDACDQLVSDIWPSEESMAHGIKHDIDCLIGILDGVIALHHQGLNDVPLEAHLDQLPDQESPLDHAHQPQLDLLLIAAKVAAIKALR